MNESTGSSIYTVSEVSSELGIRPSRLKMAIASGLLPPPDMTSRVFAKAGFSQDWLDHARALSPDKLRDIERPRDVFTEVDVPGAGRSVILREDVFESALAAAARVRERAG